MINNDIFSMKKCIKSNNKRLHKSIMKKIEQKEITKYKLAEKIGIANSTLSEQLKRLADGKGVMTDTLFRIMSALDMELKDLIK
jgi:DNA-binding Xre family transcriptional regulator